ncbi:MAG: SDR family NAD(P)-dependent oxidoreductase [Myxococcota bacterium]
MGAATQDLRGRTCLVTGSTDGHGKAVALALAARGADVVLHARNREKALAVQAEVARPAVARHRALLADFASPAAIDRAVAEYLASGRPLHVLVNNAGLVGLSRRVDEAGHELTFAVNYLAMFRLTLGLLPRLRESAPARIVNVGSDTYKIARLDFDDLMLERDYGMMKAYGQSKLAILYFTLELCTPHRGQRRHGQRRRPGPRRLEHRRRQPRSRLPPRRPPAAELLPERRARRAAVIVAADPALDGANGGYRSAAPRSPSISTPNEPPPLADDLELCGLDGDPLPAVIAGEGLQTEPFARRGDYRSDPLPGHPTRTLASRRWPADAGGLRKE